MADPQNLRLLKRLDYATGNGMTEGRDDAVQADDPSSLLVTKLQRPMLPLDNVTRPRVITSLRRVLDYPLTLVSAPAGFGKTTAVAQGLAEVTAPSIWLTVDEYDNDLRVFLDYLIAAIQTQFPDACAQTQRLLDAMQTPPVETLRASLVNELQAIATPFVVVIDDVHYLTDEAIGEFFALLLRGLPRPLHLVVITQSDPPWRLARLAGRGQLLEVRSSDLLFRLDEAKTFLEGATGAMLPADMLTFLVEHTEGWIVALRLAALNLSREPGGAVSLSELRPSSDQFTPRALVHEMLELQPAPLRDFLVRTSILDRMSAPLCAALMAQPGPDGTRGAGIEDVRAWLGKTNLFIVPLDEAGQWYRYHHLIGALLRRELASQWDAKDVASLHRRASDWLDAHGFADEALRHALAAGDTVRGAEIVERQVHARLNREDWRGIEHSLSLLPEGLRRQRPGLLMAQAWALHRQERLSTLLALGQAAEALVADPSAPVSEAERAEARGTLNVLKGYALLWRTTPGPESVVLARQALAELPRDYLYVRSGAHFTEGLGLYFTGHETEGIKVLREVVEAPNEPPTVKMRGLIGLAFLYRIRGPLLALEETISLYLKLAVEHNLGISMLWARYFLGSLHYERNELEQAVEQLEAVVEQRYLANFDCVRGAFTDLALAYQAQGRARDASATMGNLTQVGLELEMETAVQRQAVEVRLALARQDLDEALRGAAQLNGILPEAPMIWSEIPAITRAQALLAAGGANERRQALDLLDTLEAVAEATHVWKALVRILALQALGFAAEKRDAEALAKLERAVTLAEPMGLIRTFVDVGPQLARLLQRLLDRGVAPAYLRQVLAAFADEIRAAPTERLVKEGTLVEPLTVREMEILRLMGQGLSNKEIGASLVIAPETAKRHTRNIYRKLIVHSRRQALLRAQALGLLPSR